MSPDAEPAVSSPGAVESPAAVSEPAQGSASRLGTLADAFRADPEALKDPARGPHGSEPKDSEHSPEESAAPEGGAASKPGEPGVTRRGAAAKITEQQSEIDRLVSEREAERARAAEAEARVGAQEQKRQQALAAAMAKIGDDREFEALATKRMRGEVLSFEDDERLSSMLAWREHAADLWEMADRGHKTAIGRSLADRVERYGLDRATSFDAALPELVDHVVSVTETRVRREQASQIAELKAELKGWKARGGKAAVPTVGGSSASAAADLPADGASPMDWFRAGARRQEATPAAAGGRNGSR